MHRNELPLRVHSFVVYLRCNISGYFFTHHSAPSGRNDTSSSSPILRRCRCYNGIILLFIFSDTYRIWPILCRCLGDFFWWTFSLVIYNSKKKLFITSPFAHFRLWKYYLHCVKRRYPRKNLYRINLPLYKVTSIPHIIIINIY